MRDSTTPATSDGLSRAQASKTRAKLSTCRPHERPVELPIVMRFRKTNGMLIMDAFPRRRPKHFALPQQSTAGSTSARQRPSRAQACSWEDSRHPSIAQTGITPMSELVANASSQRARSSGQSTSSSAAPCSSTQADQGMDERVVVVDHEVHGASPALMTRQQKRLPRRRVAAPASGSLPNASHLGAPRSGLDLVYIRCGAGVPAGRCNKKIWAIFRAGAYA